MSIELDISTELDGSTALITGSTSGIGRATARALAGRGAHVVISGRDAKRGERAAEQIRSEGGQADFVAADLRDEAGARSLARQAVEKAGPIDILVNNAGIYPYSSTAETTESQFDAVYAVNVKAPFFLVAELGPQMARRGKGAIVNISSIAAEKGIPGKSVYGSSKAAMVLLTKAWATEFGPSGVRVNAVNPGPIRTEGTDAAGEDLKRFYDGTPAGRAGTPEEVAAAVAFLASDGAGYVQGAVLPVDGGGSAV
jgi:NAD(P)-dependent dehydrogenase (short-subunit alcohol dehydrogenase family)